MNKEDELINELTSIKKDFELIKNEIDKIRNSDILIIIDKIDRILQLLEKKSTQ